MSNYAASSANILLHGIHLDKRKRGKLLNEREI